MIDFSFILQFLAFCALVAVARAGVIQQAYSAPVAYAHQPAVYAQPAIAKTVAYAAPGKLFFNSFHISLLSSLKYQKFFRILSKPIF